MLAGNDVIDFKGHFIKGLWHPAVFAPSTSSCPNLFFQLGIHG